MKYKNLYFTFFYYFDVSTPCFINTVKSGVCGPPKEGGQSLQNSRYLEVFGLRSYEKSGR